MRMRLKGGDIATLILMSGTPIMATSGHASLADLRTGDHVWVSARPDPAHALLYGVNWMKDLDLVPFKSQSGVIVNVGQEGTGDYNAGKEGRAYTVRFGSRTFLVDLDPSSPVILRNGKKGSLADLQPGVQAQITGLRNKRTDEVTTASAVRILQRGQIGKRSTQASLAGRILKLSATRTGAEMRMRTQAGDLATVLLSRATPVMISSGRASLADLRSGDRVSVSARPDPRHPLVFSANRITDLDLVPFKNQRGIILEVGQEGTGDYNVGKEGRVYTVHFGKRLFLVDIEPGARIALKNGKMGTLSDLQPGVRVQLTGVRDTRLDEITSTSSVRIQ
jgi:hypothetical protein